MEPGSRLPPGCLPGRAGWIGWSDGGLPAPSHSCWVPGVTGPGLRGECGVLRGPWIAVGDSDPHSSSGVASQPGPAGPGPAASQQDGHSPMCPEAQWGGAPLLTSGPCLRGSALLYALAGPPLLPSAPSSCFKPSFLSATVAPRAKEPRAKAPGGQVTLIRGERQPALCPWWCPAVRLAPQHRASLPGPECCGATLQMVKLSLTDGPTLSS